MIVEHRFVLAVPDAATTARFFVDALGFVDVPVSDPGWRFVKRDACFIMLGSCPDAIAPRDLGDHSYFAYLIVDDVDAVHASLRAKNVDILSEPSTKPWGMRELAMRTPDGHRIMIAQRTL